MNINLVNLVGRAGTDPELRYFESANALCKVTLAVKRPTNRSDQPDWFNLGATR